MDGLRRTYGTATIEVARGDQQATTLHSEKRLYIARGQPMADVALRPGLLQDIYTALGEDLGDSVWAVRILIKPFVCWLWLGALLMATGGVLAVTDRRYRRQRSAATESTLSREART